MAGNPNEVRPDAVQIPPGTTLNFAPHEDGGYLLVDKPVAAEIMKRGTDADVLRFKDGEE